MISERPADVEDRAVPGNWEGDLIVGSASLLVHLPRLPQRAAGERGWTGHAGETVRDALAATITTLPRELRRTLTWDQETPAEALNGELLSLTH